MTQVITSQPYKAPLILAQSNASSSVTGTVNETTLATITVPAGAMGANGALRITLIATANSSTNNKTVKVNFGATNYLNVNLGTAQSLLALRTQVEIRNRNSTSSQIGYVASGEAGLQSPGARPMGVGFGESASVAVTSTIDTTAGNAITITGTLANTDDTLTLEGYTVEVLPS